MTTAKDRVADLALFGASPAFDEPLHVGRPNIGDREAFLRRVGDILDRKWLTNDGPMVRQFERAIEAYLGVKHCVATCNGTIALELASRALGFRGEVIVPSFTFVASVHALQWQEITPVFCDIDPETHLADPVSVEAMITPRTTGIMPVHVWGRVCDVEALEEIARRHTLSVLYDASHALGCSCNGQLVGSFGAAEVFSFHATKFVNALEGGAVVTNDDDLAEKLRLMRNFGFAGLDRVIYLGTNGKMHEVSAAMGLTNLENIDAFIAVNRRNYERYRGCLNGIEGVEMMLFAETERNNYQYIILCVDKHRCHLSRDSLVAALTKENVLARRYFYPGVHRMEPYRSYFPHAGMLLPNTERVADRVVVLPTGTGVSEGDIDVICRIVRTAVENAAVVEARAQSSGIAGTQQPDSS